MYRDRLRAAFWQVLETLAQVKNVTPDMIDFTGHEKDLELLGYFYYEGILPSASHNAADACRHVLGTVLENDYGFEWNERVLSRDDVGLTIDLETIREDTAHDQSAYYLADAILDSVKTKIAKHFLR